MHRIGDVFQPLLAEIDELGGDRSAHMAPGVSRDADAAGLREPFEARGDVDAVAIDVVRRHDDVAEIDADAELDAAVSRQPGVAGANDPLHVQGAPHRIDDTAELDKSPVAGVLDDAAAVLADLRCDDLASANLRLSLASGGSDC